MKTKFNLALVGIFALSFLSTRAAEATINVKFRAVGFDLPPTEVEFPAKGGPRRLAVSSDGFSAEQSYRGPEEITLRDTANAERVFSAPLAATKGPLLLVLSMSAAGVPRLVVLNDAAAAGSTQFANLGEKPVWVSAGTQRLAVAPGKVVSLPRLGSTQRTLPVQCFLEDGPAAAPVYSSNWALNPAQYTLVLLGDSPDSPQSVKVQRISEVTAK